jgi:hypothetical protein
MSGKKQSVEIEHLAPKTRKIKAEITKLVPDPNNPRFTTSEDDQVTPTKTLDKAITGETFRRMCPNDGDPYRIEDLCRSIKENGWQPVDAMFVKRLDGAEDRYVVLEGNRRLTAIVKLLDDPKLDKELRESIQKIEVLEVLANGQSEDAVRNQITYLLGVRHHGSLKRWSAFAQAANIYQRYKELAKINDDVFVWKQDCADEVASSLSISHAIVRERLKVFIAMRHLGTVPAIKDGAGEIRDRHYSLIEEGLKRKDLKPFLPQDDSTFALPETTVQRFIELCHFDRANREGSPIKDPREWRSLGKILTDENVEKREENTRRVMESKEFPSEVWAKRSAELRQISWETWLRRLKLRLSRINMGDTFEDEDAVTLVRDLRKLLGRLQKKENQ